MNVNYFFLRILSEQRDDCQVHSENCFLEILSRLLVCTSLSLPLFLSLALSRFQFHCDFAFFIGMQGDISCHGM